MLTVPQSCDMRSDTVHEFLISSHLSGVSVGTNSMEDPASDSKFKRWESARVTDKVVAPTFGHLHGHNYAEMYGIYLRPLRDLPVRFFEIGLGCTMLYGAGASVKLWKDYFRHPDFELFVGEYDVDCVESGRATGILSGDLKIVIGDQGDSETVARWGRETGGAFDIVVDDGSHRGDHQYISFQGLWPHVVPGGLYFIEDLAAGANEDGAELFVEVLKAWMDQLVTYRMHNAASAKSSGYPLPNEVAFINCFSEACVVGKRMAHRSEYDWADIASSTAFLRRNENSEAGMD